MGNFQYISINIYIGLIIDFITKLSKEIKLDMYIQSIYKIF